MVYWHILADFEDLRPVKFDGDGFFCRKVIQFIAALFLFMVLKVQNL
jgi:hypothetical protein